MAKRGGSRGGSRAKSGGGGGRQTKSKKTAAAEVEVVEEGGGSGIDAGIAVATCIMLVVALLFVDAHLGRYGAGMFF